MLDLRISLSPVILELIAFSVKLRFVIVELNVCLGHRILVGLRNQSNQEIHKNRTDNDLEYKPDYVNYINDKYWCNIVGMNNCISTPEFVTRIRDITSQHLEHIIEQGKLVIKHRCFSEISS